MMMFIIKSMLQVNSFMSADTLHQTPTHDFLLMLIYLCLLLFQLFIEGVLQFGKLGRFVISGEQFFVLFFEVLDDG